MSETELERAEKRYAQAKARLQALKNREATKQRKLETRRKVILGGALMDLAERDSGAAAMVDRLMRNLSREQDRKAFDGWEVSKLAPVPQGSGLESGGTVGTGGEARTGERTAGDGPGMDVGGLETAAGGQTGARPDAEMPSGRTGSTLSSRTLCGSTGEPVA